MPKKSAKGIFGIPRLLLEILQKVNRMSTQLDVLTAQVERNTSVDQSAIELLNGLAAQIADLKNDPAALQALADNLTASSDALAAAVVANTPVAP